MKDILLCITISVFAAPAGILYLFIQLLIVGYYYRLGDTYTYIYTCICICMYMCIILYVVI